MKNRIAPGIFPICIFLLLTTTVLARGPNFAVKGLWVIRHNLTSPARIDSVFKLALGMKMTDLFVQVRGRGDAYYNSKLEPRASDIKENFDPLRYILQKNLALNHPFRIHAWINTLLVWSANKPPADSAHVLINHPDWATLPAEHLGKMDSNSTIYGESYEEGIFLSPQLPAVRTYLVKLIREILIRYPVDGIHLDYIRYPRGQDDLHPNARWLFAKKYIFDPVTFLFNKEEFVANYGTSGEMYYYLLWKRFLRDNLSHLVKSISKSARAIKPDIILSAAVKPDLAEAYSVFGQDWAQWLNEKWLDWAMPMNYARSTDVFWNNIRKMIRQIDLNQCVMGIALYNQNPAQFKQKLKIIESLQLKGIVLFSYDQLKQNSRFRRIYIRYINE